MIRYIGIIKWFYDKARDANYGFIEHFKMGDVFFHIKNINPNTNTNISNLVANTPVVFSIKESRQGRDKKEAFDVELLSDQNDSIKLFYLYISIPELISDSKWLNLRNDLYKKSIQLINRVDDYAYLNKFYNLFIKHISEDIEYIKVKEAIESCREVVPYKLGCFLKSVVSKVSKKVAYQLWLNDLIDAYDIDFIANTILTESKSIQKQVINKCSNEDKIEIVSLAISGYNSFDALPMEKIKSLIDLILLIDDEECKNDLYESFIKRCTTYQKVVLWIDGYFNKLSFDKFKYQIVLLSPEYQRLFVKKVLKYIHEGLVKISLEEFTSIQTIDYATSKSLLNTDDIQLDYSTSVVLNSVLELNNQNSEEKTTQKQIKRKIFEIILDQLTDPLDVLEIKGYFDGCNGRIISEFDDKGKFIRLKNSGKKPKLHADICDGRKFLDINGNEILCEKSKREFWWCGNQQCFRPSRGLRNSDEWKSYTFLDFLTILKVDYNEIDFEMYLNTINTINRFFKHMKCRECDWVLRPVKRSNYAFYGVTNFNCKNENCGEFEKNIYLTHCMNAHCNNTIDSRDSVRCENDWYICNYCYSCCSTSAIESRIYNLQQRGIDYQGVTEGHRDQSEMFCANCGNRFKDIKKEYTKVLDWFINNKSSSKHITKSGINKFKKHWFVVSKDNLDVQEYRSNLQYYKLLGFNIPNFNNESLFKQLVAEPNDIDEVSKKLVFCDKCNNYIDLSSDFEQFITIKKFHNIRFPKTNNT